MPTDIAKPFSEMAARIEHNADAEFGGACVMIPPGGGKAIELLMLDKGGDAGQFFATLLSRIQMAMKEIDDSNRMATTFGRQR